MALVQRVFNQLSDLVFHEIDPTVGYAREVVFVDVGADTPVTMGTVAYRAKAATDTAYTLLSAAGQLVATNEFVVLYGDHYGAQTAGWTLLAADTTDNAVGYVRGMVQLKDQLIKATTAGFLNATQFAALVHLLKAQDVIVEVTAVAP